MRRRSRGAARHSRRRGRRVWPILLFVPIVAVSTGALLVMDAHTQGARLPIAQGVAGGFHPVAGSFVPDGRRLAECAGSQTCVEQAFGNLAYARGPKRALGVLEVELTRDRGIERNCHRIVHVIGSAALSRNDGNVARTFAQGSSACASGYYHGILERAFVGVKTRAGLARVAGEVCEDVEIRRRGFLDYQCRHGLGHGFMIQTGYDLPTALALCSGLGSGWDRATCTNGVFMENVSTRFGFRSSWLDEDDPLYPCNSVASVHRRSCYARVTTWILQLEKNDFRRTAERCAATGQWATACFRGFGRDAVVDARYRDFDRVHQLCALAAQPYAGQCYLGAARAFADSAGRAGAARAAQFCAGAAPSSRSGCVAGYGIVVGLVSQTNEARRRTCLRLARQLASACLAAAKAEIDPAGREAWA